MRLAWLPSSLWRRAISPAVLWSLWGWRRPTLSPMPSFLVLPLQTLLRFPAIHTQRSREPQASASFWRVEGRPEQCLSGISGCSEVCSEMSQVPSYPRMFPTTTSAHHLKFPCWESQLSTFYPQKSSVEMEYCKGRITCGTSNTHYTDILMSQSSWRGGVRALNK